MIGWDRFTKSLQNEEIYCETHNDSFIVQLRRDKEEKDYVWMIDSHIIVRSRDRRTAIDDLTMWCEANRYNFC